MKKKVLIETIQKAYDVKPSAKGKTFIREYQRRKINLFDILKMEMRHINWLCMCLMLVVLFVAVCVCKRFPKTAWGYGSMMPIFVLFGTIAFGRSQRYGMWELEYVSRFSMVFLKMVRVFLAGVFSTLALIICSVFMYLCLRIKAAYIIMLTMIPFLLTSYGSMLLIRHWHSPHNIYGCVVIATICAILPLIQNIKSLLGEVPLGGAIVLAVILVITTGKEIIQFVKAESEEPAWNLF